MKITPNQFVSPLLCIGYATLALLGFSPLTLAWGPDGHTAIGVLAIEQLQPEARSELGRIVGPLDHQAMEKACNWPDKIRDTKEWEWTAPRHYINIPRGESHYMESRDCPDRICNTEAIKITAADLANRQSRKEERWQAFAWLCHLVGDLHQPLHGGFADDRGGNDTNVLFRGEKINLHTFWDHELIDVFAGNAQNLVQLLRATPAIQTDSGWSAEMADDWTSESHALAEQKAYPSSMNIDGNFTQQSWDITQHQLRLAASRIALIINSELQASESIRDPSRSGNQ